MIPMLLFIPVALSLVLAVVRSRALGSAFLVGYSVLHFAVSIELALRGGSFTAYFRTDDANILFLLLLSIVMLGVSFYAVFFFHEERAARSEQEHSTAVLFLLLFIDSINAALLSTNLGLLWVFLEASTLTSVALVNFERRQASLEAAWKYVFICSIGISLAFIGIVFLSIGSQHTTASLFFADLERSAPGTARVWLELAFPFIVVGFGTKMGLAPVHSWLPDAHSEAPAPISALLSGALLNAALFGILRVMRIMSDAGIGAFAGTLLAVMGLLSMFVSGVFILGARNYKRMLAYSSIENMGIISIGFGIGGAGVFAGLLHTVGHSLAKGSFFLCSGNIHHHSGSREIAHSAGMLKRDPATAWLWIASFIAISGIPPFVTFLSELLLIKRLLAVSLPVAILFLVLLLVVVYGMGRSVMQIVADAAPGSARAEVTSESEGAYPASAGQAERASANAEPREPGWRPLLEPPPAETRGARLPLHAYLPQVVLLGAAVALGVTLPRPIAHLLHAAALSLGALQ